MMTHISNRSDRRGFTLVEVMIGVFVFSMVMVAVFQVFSHSMLTAGRTLDLSRVNQTLQYQMETLRATPWDDLAALSGTRTINVDGQGIPVDGNGKRPFDWKAFGFEQRIDSRGSDHYEVTLSITWANSRGRTDSHQIKNWITKDGLNDFFTRTTAE